MNKLINLIVIFLSLRFFIPMIFLNVHILAEHPKFFNLFAGVFVIVVKFIYNLWMKYSKRKDMNLKNNLLNSLFKGLIVSAGYYILEDIKTRVQITSELDENTIKASFVTFILIIFILGKCLISP
jgi:heme/copper-type cytochrome/quinol oxidase subunit 4